MSYIKPEFEAVGSTGDLKDYRVISASKEKDGTFTFKVELGERKVSSMDKFVKEYLYELGRIALIAALPVAIIALESGVDWRTALILVVVAVLKAIDRALHQSKLAEKGIVRF